MAGAGDEVDAAVADTASSDPDTDAASGRSAPPRQVRPGDRLGRYEIADELGEGGMAMVFRARDRELRREVAIKVLFPHLARRAEVVRRFHREARAAAGLEHANILRIYDVGGAEGEDPPYIVMELIRGRTLLREVEQRGAMLAEIAACIGALVGDALAAAHAAGVIHRDVKPANVLIAPGGRLLLADFGVARLETEDSLVTRTGALLGTPAYMSPEQASGDTATARSDLYSLGATLYQLETGALPYGGSPAKVMSAMAAGGPVPAVRRRPACGPDLSKLIERLMAPDPSARPASAAAIAAELRALAAAGGFGDPAEELAAYFEDPEGFLRARTPAVVTTLVTAARQALAAARLPRAMALADRASSLAPDDPSVAELVRAVTEDGHASRRRRGLAVGVATLALAGGVAAVGWRLWGSASEAGALPPSDAAPPGTDAGPLDAPGGMVHGHGDASLPDVPRTVPRDAAMGSPPRPSVRRPAFVDAGVRHARDAEAPPAIELAPAPTDAAWPAEPPAMDAGLEPTTASAHVIIRNDVWCNIWIDQVDRGNRRNQRLEVTAGHHIVRCVNPLGEWTREIEVAPGETQTLTGTLRDIEVTLAVDATIDGTPHARGTVVRLKPGRVEVIAGGKRQFVTVQRNCTLRDAPVLGCYL